MERELSDGLDEIDALERRRLAALVRADKDEMAALHADDYELIPPGGSPITRSEYLDGIASGELRYAVFEPSSEVRVRRLGDTAVVRYVARIVIDYPGGHEEGRYWHLDYWERRAPGWQAVWSQATWIPDGRGL